MQNYIQKGENLTVAAPYALTAGQGALVGALFGVATSTAANGADVVLVTRGVFDLTRAAAITVAQGANVYWDNAAKNVTTTSAANTLIGVCAVASLVGNTTIVVLLDGAIR